MGVVLKPVQVQTHTLSSHTVTYMRNILSSARRHACVKNAHTQTIPSITAPEFIENIFLKSLKEIVHSLLHISKGKLEKQCCSFY